MRITHSGLEGTGYTGARDLLPNTIQLRRISTRRKCRDEK